MIDKGIWVYDIETLASCFSYCGYNVHTKQIVKYVIHKDKDEFSDLIGHLLGSHKQVKIKMHVGYNNLNFDYPIIHFMIKLHDKLIKNAKTNFLYDETGDQICNLIYNEVQRIITASNNKQFTVIREHEVLIPQLDLYKIWHYNNPARSTSLKALQISMNYPNVMEMPFEHSKKDITLKEVDNILEYNLNDVLSTYEFLKLSKDKIGLRSNIKNKYNINCKNFSDVKIGEQLLFNLYCELADKDEREIKLKKTYRDQINLSECIFPYIQFKSKEFNTLLDKLKNTIIKETKNGFSESVIYEGFKYDFGQGGIHGCIKPGIYKSDDDYIIMDLDVASLYPSIAILNKLYPQHLGEEFVDVYNDILNQRIKAKKEGNMIISDALKLSLNGAYGKSNEETSFLYDPKFTMSITLNGQLLLTMLAEKLVNHINCEVLQINTDGITIRLDKECLENYYQICKEWEEQTKLQLEFVEYSLMVIRDVNLAS
jgi:hypothetical protein